MVEVDAGEVALGEAALNALMNEHVSRSRGSTCAGTGSGRGCSESPRNVLPVAERDADDPTLTCIAAAAGDDYPEFSPLRRRVRPTPLNRVLPPRGALVIAHGMLAARTRYLRRA